MLAKLKTFSLMGIDAIPVEVEVDVSPAGLPKVVLVGLPEPPVNESTHRVERALANSGFQRPQNRVVINLAPAGLAKDAGSFDLPIALGIVAGSGQFAFGPVGSRRCELPLGHVLSSLAESSARLDRGARRRCWGDCWSHDCSHVYVSPLTVTEAGGVRVRLCGLPERPPANRAAVLAKPAR
jgi:hypothetical protein